MQLHESASTVNGSGPSIDDDEREDDELAPESDYSYLFDAPSYSEFIKLKPNSRAKTYERKTASMMKAGLVMSLNSHQYPDAATFLKHGPGFATAAGNLAAEDPRAAKIIDMLTAPDSPYVMFALAAMPLFSQLVRNHERDVKTAATTWREKRAERKQAKISGYKPTKQASPITVRLFKREFKLPIRLRFKLPSFKHMFGAFMTPTQYPDEITQEVFSDPSVVKALHKMGIYPRGESDEA